jgi:WD40 repeat protein
MAQVAEPVQTQSIPETPYVGLGYYTEEYADVFFGRDAERKKIIGNLRASRLTLLYAESGVGKSSLLRAGVLARLHELAHESLGERGTPRYVPVVFSSWRDEPRERLIAEIESAIAPFLPAGTTLDLPRDTVQAAIAAAAEAVDATALVILDQFEDYLLYRSEEARLADELARCINNSELRANFLIAIREDAYAGLGDLFKGRLANVYGNYLHLEYLDKTAARDAIERPIERFNEAHPDEEPIVLGPGLVDAVLEQVARGKIVIGDAGRGALDGAGAGDSRYVETPYLQLVMRRLWDMERKVGSRTLRAETLVELGGAETIIREHLERAMSGFSDDQRLELAAAFKFLVTPSGTKIALSARDLAQFAEVPEVDLAEELEKLAGDMRILRPIAPAKPGDPTRYEIYHDSLAPAFLAWHRVQAEKQLEAEKAEARQDALRERKRARIFSALAVVASLLLALALVAVVYAWHESGQASDAKKRIQSDLLAARAQVDIASPETAIPLAAEAYQTYKTLEARSAVLAVSHHFARLRGVLTPPIPQGYETVAYSPGSLRNPRSEWIAAGGSRNTIDIWHNGRYVGSLTGHKGEVQDLAFNPKFPVLLASASVDGTVRIWNVTTRRLLKTLATHGFEQDALAFSPDGTVLASGGTSGFVRLWTLVKGLPSRAPELIPYSNHVKGFEILAMAFNRHLLAVGGYDSNYKGFIEVYSDSGQLMSVKLNAAEGSAVTALAFDPTVGNASFSALYSGSDDGKLDWWLIGKDIVNANHPTAAASDRISELSVSPDRKELVTTSNDGTITFWDENGRRLGESVQLAGAVNGAAFSPDGSTVAAAGSDGMVTLWNARRQLRLGWRIDYPLNTFVNDVAFGRDAAQRDSMKLAVLRGDPSGLHSFLDIWTIGSADRFDLTAPCTHHSNCTGYPLSGSPMHLAVSPTGDRLAVTGAGGTAVLYDLTGKTTSVRTLPPSGPSSPESADVAFDRTGRMLAAAADRNITIWHLDGMRLAGKSLVLRSSSPVLTVAFSPATSLLASGGQDGRVELWDLATRKPTLLGYHTGRVNRLAFSPDGATLASAGEDGLVILWNVDKRTKLGSITLGTAATDIAFSDDGRTVAASTFGVGGNEGSISLWDVATREQLGEPYRGLATMSAVAFRTRFKMSSGVA